MEDWNNISKATQIMLQLVLRKKKITNKKIKIKQFCIKNINNLAQQNNNNNMGVS